jgi:hypothetical protein
VEKVIRDGNVAVLYSPGFGAGWFSWNHREELMYHPKLVEMVEAGREREITSEWLAKELGDEYEEVYCGGARELEIRWLPAGTKFRIYEYDGAESVVTLDEEEYFTA